MQREIIRFGNALNQVSFGDLGPLEQNIFFKILRELQRSGFKPITFTPAEIRNFVGKNSTLKELAEISVSLRDSIFKKDFTLISEYTNADGEEVVQSDFINFFKRMTVKAHKKTGNLESLEVEINEHFEFLLKELKMCFTTMELSEFLALRNKHAKTIFRLLCQFRGTGRAVFKWDQFKNQLAISDGYRMFDIDRRVLKPTLRELSCNDMFKQLETENDRPVFKNLQVRKIKTGKQITAIEFTWDVKPGERVIDAEPVKDEPQQVQEKTSAPPPAAEKPQQPTSAASGEPQPLERGPASPEVLELMDEAFNLLGKGVKVLR